MTEPVTAPPTAPPAPPSAPTPKPQGRFGREVRIVLTTMGFTSLAWLVIGGFFVGWLWDRPDAAAPVMAAAEAQPDGDPQMPDVGGEPVPQPLAPGANLIVPVAGVTADRLTDTFTDSRAAGARHHDAIDIMAPAGTPVMAAASGSVEKLFTSDEGGKTVYIRSGDGNWIYYYAHLQSYAPGLAEGQAVRAGQRIASVGATGNADPAAPHLHFAVMAMAPGEQWHEGAAVNPYPLLAGQR